MSVRDFLCSVLLKNVHYCRLCLRTESERKLVPGDNYRRLVQKLVHIEDKKSDEECSVCFVCDAMLQRAMSTLELVQAAQKFALKLSQQFVDIVRQHGGSMTFENDFENKFNSSLALCQGKTRLCTTETLTIDSTDTFAVDPAPARVAPLAPAGIASGVGVPAMIGGVAGQLIVLPADSAHQLSDLYQLGHVRELVAGGAPAGALPPGWRVVQLAGGAGAVPEASVPEAGGAVPEAEVADCVAIIETNISDEMRRAGAGSSEGLCVIPDSLMELGEGPATDDKACIDRRTNKLVVPYDSLSGPVTSTRPIHEPDEPDEPDEPPAAPPGKVARLGRGAPAVEVIDLVGETIAGQMRESWRPSTQPPVYGQPIKPIPRDKEVDWEDRIPMEVISYADEPASAATRRGGRRAGALGRIGHVYSQAPRAAPAAVRARAPHLDAETT